MTKRTKLATLLIVPALLAIFACAAIFAFPAVGAQVADVLRQVAGDEAVADLEALVYGTKDRVDQQRYALGLKPDEAPWAIAEATPIDTQPTPVVIPATAAPATAAPAGAAIATTVPRATPIPPFQPAVLPAFTKKAGEGQWQPLIKDTADRVLAWRTFLAPDPQRPYVSIGIVAVDLRNTRLGFVLGTQEPVSTQAITRSGRIPAADFTAERLLATFNGGFKTQHGQYGVGFNQRTLVPPREGFATVALRRDGSLRIGAWDKAFAQDERDYQWWRQNGPPIINNGAINPLTENTNASNWGAALDGNVAVWRSALGISKDGNTLYYAAGDAVVMTAMARALTTAGAHAAMQLDINNSWVHFGSIRWMAGKPEPEPLFDSWRNQEPRRYLGAYSRDYFYLAVR